MQFKAVVIGASAGGMEAIRSILSSLPTDFSLPIIIVQHIKAGKISQTEDYFKRYCKIEIKEAESNMKIDKGTAYFAPPDYHLLVEKNKTLTLSVEEKVNYSRPSIDILFETAADVYGNELIGVILTGASGDGSKGLLSIKEKGGLCIVENPETAFINTMPCEALKLVDADYILSIKEIAQKLNNYRDLRFKR